jgi:Fe-S cluster assembly protein SufD
MKAIERFAADFDSIMKLSDDNLNNLRKESFEEFRKKGLPTRKEEYWKYSDPSIISKIELELGTSSEYKDDNYDIILVNGNIVKKLKDCKMGNIPDGIKEGELSESILGKKEKPFLNLNNAFTTSGLYLILEENSKQTIKILNLVNNEKSLQAVHPRMEIIANSNSDSLILEEFRIVGNGTNFINSVTEFILKDGANIEHIIVDDFAEETYHVANVCAKQNKNSHFTSHNFSVGKKFARRDFNIELDESGANCNLFGLYFVDKENHIDHHTTIEHKDSHCNSNENYKGILSGKSTGVFNGRIHVHPNAQKTDAIQNNKNLLLSDDSIIHTKPELEIYADDVKCTHGATVGQLDEKALFYLRSRGLSQKESQKLLMRAYVGEIIDEISNEKLRNELMEMILDRLPEGG